MARRWSGGAMRNQTLSSHGACRVSGAERERLGQDTRREKNWKRWGPYLSERQWGTVREDYSEGGTSWDYFPHDHARSRAYRWGEDGLLGITDREGRLCFALALWNGRDPILKERLFGLTRDRGEPRRGREGGVLLPRRRADPRLPEGALQVSAGRVPLRAAGRRRIDVAAWTIASTSSLDTGVFDQDRYFDVTVEYAKASPDDVLIRITVENLGPEPAAARPPADPVVPQHLVVGTDWRGLLAARPSIRGLDARQIEAVHASLGAFRLAAEPAAAEPDGSVVPRWLFTENETNFSRLFGGPNTGPHVKDAFHEVVIHGNEPAASPTGPGTKAAAWYRLRIRRAPAAPCDCASRWRARAQRNPSGRSSIRSFSSGSPRPTLSTPG